MGSAVSAPVHSVPLAVPIPVYWPAGGSRSSAIEAELV